MPAVIGTATSSDWSFSGSLLTFFFPVGLFVVVATTLYLQFSRPHTIPGLKPLMPARATASASAPPAAQAGAAHDEDAAPAAPHQSRRSDTDEQEAAGARDDHHDEPGAAG